ncbi:MAG: helix-turn-helix domain-containing protein [Trueperaceae bacterium]|nr:helix-turn-helix domain-containing protein [Trueperaceae bacterium]
MSDTIQRQEYTDVLTYGPGEVVLFPGESDDIYRVREGLIRIHTVDDEGNGLTLRYVKPGGYFGEEAICGLSRRYFAEAVTPSTVEVRSPVTLEPEENLDLTAHLVAAIERLYRSLHRLSGKRLKSRIAAELLDLKDSALATESDSGDPVVHITHDDLAAAVGSVRETVTKVVGELSRGGAISAGYGKIMLVDTELLKEIAGE